MKWKVFKNPGVIATARPVFVHNQALQRRRLKPASSLIAKRKWQVPVTFWLIFIEHARTFSMAFFGRSKTMLKRFCGRTAFDAFLLMGKRFSLTGLKDIIYIRKGSICSILCP